MAKSPASASSPDTSFFNSIRTFLANIFKISPPAVPPPHPEYGLLERIILKSLAANLSFLYGTPVNVELERLNRESLDKFIDSFDSGYILSCHDLTEETVRCLYCYSRAGLAALSARYRQARATPIASAPNDVEIMRKVDGRLSTLFTAQWRPNLEGSTSPVFSRTLRIPKPVSGDGKDELRWQADIFGLAWRITVGKTAFYLFVPNGYDKRTEHWAAESDAFLNTVKRDVLTLSTEGAPADDGADDVDLEIIIQKPTEFALGSLFLPSFLRLGDLYFRTRFKKIRTFRVKGPLTDDEFSQWFLVILEVGGFRSPYLYRIVGHSVENFSRLFDDPLKLLSAIMTANVGFFGEKRPGLKIHGEIRACLAPKLPEGTPMASLIAETRSPRGKFQWETVLSAAMLNRLCDTFFDPWELEAYQASSRNFLLAILSLNRELFRLHLRGNFASTGVCWDSSGGAVPTTSMPFHEFTDLISDHDLRIIIQNHLIPAIGLVGILGLLTIRRNFPDADGGSTYRVFPLEYDETKFLACLNESGKRQWHEMTERHEYWSCDDREFDGRNTRIMAGIGAAMLAGKLNLSFRARCILEQQVLGPLTKRQAEELEGLIANRVPLAKLEAIDSVRRRELVARLSRRRLALVFLGHADHINPFFAATMSEFGIKDLSDDVAVLERRRADGELALSEAVEAKLELEETVVEHLLVEALKTVGPERAAKILRNMDNELLLKSLSYRRQSKSPIDDAIRTVLSSEREAGAITDSRKFMIEFPDAADRLAVVAARIDILKALKRR